MSKTSKIILITIVATCLLLGLGYAAIQNISLNITGNVAAQVNSENFKVRFIGTPTVSDSTYATATIVDDTNATIEVSGLTSKGQKVTASYDIKNESGDLSADLNVVATTTNMEYFTITSELAKQSIAAGETTNVVVTVELAKTPIYGPVSTDIAIELTAIPVQPGEEGLTEDITTYSQTLTGLTGQGFFAGQVYSTEPVDGEFESAIFYTDGSMEVYKNGKFVDLYPAGTAVYKDHVIDVSNYTGEGGSYVTVSFDGMELDFLGKHATLDKTFFEVYGLESGEFYGRSVNNSFMWLKTFPYVMKSADIYLCGDYTYFGSGKNWWCTVDSVRPSTYPSGYVEVDTTKTSYGEIKAYVNGYPTTSLYSAFSHLTNLRTAPKIPNTVTNLNFAFSDCTKLTAPPEIPSSVTHMEFTFSNCTNMGGYFTIHAQKLESYDKCLENVYVAAFTFRGTAPSEVFTQIKSTGK